MVNRDQVSRFHHLQNLEGSPRAGHQDLLSDPPLPWIDQPKNTLRDVSRIHQETDLGWSAATSGDDDASGDENHTITHSCKNKIILDECSTVVEIDHLRNR